MCTVIAMQKTGCFGRTLDLEYHYNETMTVLPQGTVLSFRCLPQCATRYALLGVAAVQQGQFLLYDAINEAGLYCAALNFPHSAAYLPTAHGFDNLASFEVIPWILSQCATVSEARTLLARARVTSIPFSASLPPTPLHWFVADSHESIAVEPLTDGLHVTDDPVCVLTNEPPLPMQLSQLQTFCHLTAEPAVNRFAPSLPLTPHSRGLGAVGLPGDWSSPSRFVRAAFVCANAQPDGDGVTQCFHALHAVAVPCGCIRPGEGKPPVSTVYTACYDAVAGRLHCTTCDDLTVRSLSFAQGGTIPLF